MCCATSGSQLAPPGDRNMSGQTQGVTERLTVCIHGPFPLISHLVAKHRRS
eukprot:jgi/Botrbrau1/15378/Bobra.43_2s0009.1